MNQYLKALVITTILVGGTAGLFLFLCWAPEPYAVLIIAGITSLVFVYFMVLYGIQESERENENS
jgi:hypothetical protein